MNAHHVSIELREVHAAYDRYEVLAGISLSIEKNSRWAVIGPNGAGKSTLIRIVAGLTKASRGTVLVEGNRIKGYAARNRARILAYMPQKPEGVIPYSVHDFVMLGRYCVMGLLGVPSREDRELVADAMDICDIRHLAMRLMSTLSGGEFQRVLLAGAVAQGAPLLLLDEPTTFLDPAHERQFFEALARLHTRRELTTVIITHDINSALQRCTHIAALRHGRLMFGGTAGEFRTRCPSILRDLFSIDFSAFAGRDGGSTVFGTWESL
ncbi:MAG: ABC transporter ATP-binding protein [Chitinispirillaceae bacterium]|nr:ABC transporter ATP-binding protein [Chitinispirillaceae bacterium]